MVNTQIKFLQTSDLLAYASGSVGKHRASHTVWCFSYKANRYQPISVYKVNPYNPFLDLIHRRINMASPAYLWIIDDQGQEIKSQCKVQGREGSIEVLAFDYGVSIPTDEHTGATTGTRKHKTARFTKAFCPASPILFGACCNGKTLKSMTLKWYRADDNGKEQEYFTHTLEDVKVVAYQQNLHHIKDHNKDLHVHEDEFAVRFSKISIKNHEGNIEATDTWLERG